MCHGAQGSQSPLYWLWGNQCTKERIPKRGVRWEGGAAIEPLRGVLYRALFATSIRWKYAFCDAMINAERTVTTFRNR